MSGPNRHATNTRAVAMAIAQLATWPCIPAKRGRTPLSPGRLRPPPSYRATTPTSSMGLFETLWDRLPRQSARWALFGRRRSGSSGNGTGSSRRSSRGQPTQESILGPISITIYVSMNNGDSDAMDKRLASPFRAGCWGCPVRSLTVLHPLPSILSTHSLAPCTLAPRFLRSYTHGLR